VDAEQVLRTAGRRSPGLVTLALLLSPAVRIEPELIRAVRLELLPKLPAAAEGDLWFSALVSARGLDGIVLDPDVASVLRERARAILLPPSGQAEPDDGPGPDDLRRTRDLIDQLHAGSPPVLRLEETVNWLAVSEADPAASIEAELQRAVDAIRRGRTGISRWAARALPRMPEAARGTTAAWLLAQGARRRLGAREWGGTGTPEIERVGDLASLLPRQDDVLLGVRRSGERLDLGEVGRDGVSVRVLDTDPRVLALQDPGRKDEQVIQIRHDARVSLQVGPGPVRLRTPRGDIYQPEEATGDGTARLRPSCVTVDLAGTTAVGVAIAADRILTALPGAEAGAMTTVTGPSGASVAGPVTAAKGGLAVLRVSGLPEGVQPTALPWAREPQPGERWHGLIPGQPKVWTEVTGIITTGTAAQFTAVLDEPGPSLLPGCPVVIGGVLAGLVTSPLRGDWYVAGLASAMLLLELSPEPAQLPGLGRIANAITLEFHGGFGGLRPRGEDPPLAAAVGLSVGQLERLRGSAEWAVQAGVNVRAAPRWRRPAGPDRFSAAILAALDEASAALRSSPYLNPRRLAESGDTALTVDGLLSVFASELPGLDEWDPWAARPAQGTERVQALLAAVSSACASDTNVPQPARTVLMDASHHLYPQWWGIRDDLALTGLPDVTADQAFPDFLEAYLGWCLTVLRQVETFAPDRNYDMRYSIPRRDAEALPVTRFGLVQSPRERERGRDAAVTLGGRFSALIGLWAWTFLELADLVHLAARQPPRYPAPPSPASA
jgi:hypothetical protein